MAVLMAGPLHRPGREWTGHAVGDGARGSETCWLGGARWLEAAESTASTLASWCQNPPASAALSPALEIQIEYWQAGLDGVQGKERKGPSGGREVSVHMKTFETLNCIQGIQSKHSTLLPALPSALSPPTLKFRMEERITSLISRNRAPHRSLLVQNQNCFNETLALLFLFTRSQVSAAKILLQKHLHNSAESPTATRILLTCH